MRIASAVRDLLLDHGLRAVGDCALDLDAAVHRPGMHHDRVAMSQPQSLLGEPVAAGVLLRIRNVAELGEALALHAQRHHDVGTADAARRARSTRFERRRTRRPRARARPGPTSRSSPTPNFVERLMRRARDARVLDVADDRDADLAHVALVALDRHEVEQALRRMRDVRLAGVQHADVRRNLLRDARRHAGARVADHEDVHLHRLQA